MKILKAIIKIFILSVIATFIYWSIYSSNNIPVEYNWAVLKICMLGVILGAITSTIK